MMTAAAYTSTDSQNSHVKVLQKGLSHSQGEGDGFVFVWSILSLLTHTEADMEAKRRPLSCTGYIHDLAGSQHF
jgi:hypothetical protein